MSSTRLVERPGGLGADRPARRQPHVGDEHVGARPRHRPGILRREDVGAGEQAELPRGANHLHLERVAHARLLEVLAEDPVDEADGGKVLDAREAGLLHLPEEDRHEPEGIRAADAGEDRRRLHDRQHLARHLHDDRVRVAVGEEAGEGSPARHAIPPGVVDDDEIGAAGLRALRREPGPGAGADDRPAVLHLRPQARQRFLPLHARTSPAVQAW